MQASPGSTEKEETLRSFVTDVTEKTGKALSLVIVDQEKCFRYGYALKIEALKGQLTGYQGEIIHPGYKSFCKMVSLTSRGMCWSIVLQHFCLGSVWGHSSDFPLCSRAQNPLRRRKSGMANKQAKEKHQQKRESSTGLMVSRVDMEEVRASYSPAFCTCSGVLTGYVGRSPTETK